MLYHRFAPTQKVFSAYFPSFERPIVLWPFVGTTRFWLLEVIALKIVVDLLKLKYFHHFCFSLWWNCLKFHVQSRRHQYRRPQAFFLLLRR